MQPAVFGAIFEQGDLVLISDHINFTGSNPLIGTNDPRLGARFFDMTEAYSLRLRDLARDYRGQGRLLDAAGRLHLRELDPAMKHPRRFKRVSHHGRRPCRHVDRA